jgi:DNA primase
MTYEVANNDAALALTEDGANGTVNILTNDTDIDGNPTPTSGHTIDLDPASGVQNTTTPEVAGHMILQQSCDIVTQR